MNDFISWWGLSLNETLLVAALLLVVIDFFFVTDVPTHVAYVLVALVVTREIPGHILYKVLGGVLSWFALVSFHYLVWRNVLKAVSNRFVAPDRHKLASERAVGAEGEVREIEGRRVLSIEGDLWPIDGGEGFEPGARVRVVSERNGAVRVELLPHTDSADKA